MKRYLYVDVPFDCLSVRIEDVGIAYAREAKVINVDRVDEIMMLGLQLDTLDRTMHLYTKFKNEEKSRTEQRDQVERNQREVQDV